MDAVLEFLSQNVGPSAFVLLLACGLGLPPWAEELVTVAVGYFVAEGNISLPAALVWCWAGLMAGDSIVFWLGQFVGERLYTAPVIRRALGPKRRHRFNRYFLKYGTATVFLARFIMGFRILAYFVAGNLRMPYWKFALLDAVGSAIYAPAGVLIGKLVGQNLTEGLEILRNFEIPLAALAALILLLVIRRYRSGRLHRLRVLRETRRKRQESRMQAVRESKPTEPPGNAGAPEASETQPRSELRVAEPGAQTDAHMPHG